MCLHSRYAHIQQEPCSWLQQPRSCYCLSAFITLGMQSRITSLFSSVYSVPLITILRTSRRTRTDRGRLRPQVTMTSMITSPAEQKHLEELTAWSLSLGDKAFVHQHVVDAWAAQHASEQSRPISVAFALIGLYLHLERGLTGRQVQRVHMLLGQPRGRGPGRKDWPRFPLP